MSKQLGLDASVLSERRTISRAGVASSKRPPLSQALTGCSAGWRVAGGQEGTWNNALSDVAAVSPTDIWAVGTSQTTLPDFSTLTLLDEGFAEHWDGTGWKVTALPAVGPSANDVTGVAAIASNDVWVVGFSSDPVSTGPIQGTRLHWDGTSWGNGGPSAAVAYNNVLNDVAGETTNDVWAVGAQSVSGVDQTLIEHWNGTSWSIPPSPNVGTGNNALYGVTARAANDAWAVGIYRATASAPRKTLIEHWDGTSWSVVPSPNFYDNPGFPSGDTLLSVAAGSATDAWAVGYALGSNGGDFGITLHLIGSTWVEVPMNEPSLYSEIVGDVVTMGPTDYWAVGAYTPGAEAPGPDQPFANHFDGSAWTLSIGSPASGSVGDDFFSVSEPIAGDVWAVGTSFGNANPDQNLVENYSGLAAPTSVAATSGDQSATVSWSAPCSDGGSPITSYVVTASDGCTVAGSVTVTGAPPATTATFSGLSNGSSFTFTVAAVNAFGVGPPSAASNAVIPAGATTPTSVTACSPRQYTLSGSDGSTWQDLDPTNLTVSFTPAVNSWAVLSGNADMWTSSAGYNQDLGVALTGGIYPTAPGQPQAWKESGGFAGTYSPNAAFVQAAIHVNAGTTYSARLQWKANRPDPGSIWAGAGPVTSGFSPTRLSVQLTPTTSATVFTTASTTQYHITGTDGTTWTNIDAANLSLPFTPPPSNWLAFASGNADLWTSSGGYNQDIGVALSGPGYPTVPGQPEAWKESGGFAGTYSPNAAFAQVPRAVSGGNEYTATLQWKANKADPGSIWAGAGPINGHYSPTTLTVILVPASGALVASRTQQYMQADSDGSFWRAIDPALNLSVAPGVSGNYLISANADLWTVAAGYNQDVGIMVSGGAYGSGTLVAWKESGGFAGTFSPNAAFVTTTVHLDGGTTYFVLPVWKANVLAQSAATTLCGSPPQLESSCIAVGAGPISAQFSPTWLTAIPLSS